MPVHGDGRLKVTQLKFTHMPGKHPPTDFHQIWFDWLLADIIDCDKFWDNRLRGFVLAGDQFQISHHKRAALPRQPVMTRP